VVLANPTYIHGIYLYGSGHPYLYTRYIFIWFWQTPQPFCRCTVCVCLVGSWVDHLCRICRGGQNHIYTVNVPYFGREVTKYTGIYGIYIRCWPNLGICIMTVTLRTQICLSFPATQADKCRTPKEPSHFP